MGDGRAYQGEQTTKALENKEEVGKEGRGCYCSRIQLRSGEIAIVVTDVRGENKYLPDDR